ncbi:WD40 domain containing protein [Trichuris trichiura]|uniref:WD40 domain containing protein n=1 Tax=Trichuris trichiura TaxID=36087 RepID=A0A077ZA41_TRITR|nr:WD40 domain containing protein [Trichuris trichiura]
MEATTCDGVAELATLVTNSKFLYDTIVRVVFGGAALTIQWMPSEGSRIGGESSDAEGLFNRNLLVGSLDGLLKVCEATVPGPAYDEYYCSTDPLRVVKAVTVNCEINRARYMPRKPNIVAVKCQTPEVVVVNLDSAPSCLESEQLIVEELGSANSVKLNGHSDEGFGLSWNQTHAGYLLSGANDGTVCVWDVSKAMESESARTPIHKWNRCTTPVNDVTWNMKDASVFAYVADDGRLILEDIRVSGEKSLATVKAHDGQKVLSVAFNPENAYILLTGSSKGDIKVWDTRKLQEEVHWIECEEEKEIFRLEWCPAKESVFAAGDTGADITLYDLSKIGDEIDDVTTEYGGAEKIFTHKFHVSEISDISWDEEIPWLIASVCEGWVCTLWKITGDIYKDDDSNVSISDSELNSMLEMSSEE